MAVSTSTAWISPTTATSDSASGTVAWTSPASVTASDNTRASASLSGAVTSELLSCQFGSLIADAVTSSATIDGVEVRVEGYESTSGLTAETALYDTSGGTIGTAKSTSLPVGSATSEAVVTLGSSSDTWGASLTRADLVAETFRVVFAASLSRDSGVTYVDHIQIRVHYTYTPPAEPQDSVALFWSAP